MHLSNDSDDSDDNNKNNNKNNIKNECANIPKMDINPI